jgi:WD40 repeat protein
MLMLRTVDLYTKCELALWQPATGTTLATAVHDVARVACLAFSPDGQRLAIGTMDGDIHFGSRDGLRLDSKLEKAHPTKDGVYELKFDPSGRVLVSAGAKELKLWDVASGKALGRQTASSRNHAPKLHVSTVTSSHVLTCEPLCLFEFVF